MFDPLKTTQDIFTLISDVKSLKEQVSRLDERIFNHHERIVKLENAEKEIMLKAEISAIKGVAHLNTHFVERIVNIEKATGITPPPLPKLFPTE